MSPLVLALAAGVLASLGALCGVAAASNTVPLPPRKPAEMAPAPPLPPEKPAGSPVVDKPTDPGAAVTPVVPERANLAVTDETACEERLHRLGTVFTIRPAIADGACQVPSPLEVTRLSGEVTLAAPTVLNCPAAEALARWVAEVVAPEARQRLSAGLTGVSAQGYACRTRNSDPSAMVSEHAGANATDVMGLVLAGRPAFTIGSLPVEDRDGHALEDAIRRGACSYFETVLGPGADPEHANHFHLDRRVRANGYRICE